MFPESIYKSSTKFFKFNASKYSSLCKISPFFRHRWTIFRVVLHFAQTNDKNLEPTSWCEEKGAEDPLIVKLLSADYEHEKVDIAR